MSTRGLIAKPEGDAWVGTYHHWDSHPSGLGVTLMEAHAGHFNGDVEAMIAYLVDGEKVGWSTINGADWSLPKGWHDSQNPDEPCAVCGREMWRHYAQYYPEGGPTDPMVNGTRRASLVKPSEIVQLGHSFGHRPPPPLGPQSYTARGETPTNPEGDYTRPSDEDAGGAEWVYVLCPGGVLVFEGDVGMFGMGGGNFGNPVLVPWGDVPAMLAVEDRGDEGE